MWGGKQGEELLLSGALRGGDASPRDLINGPGAMTGWEARAGAGCSAPGRGARLRGGKAGARACHPSRWHLPHDPGPSIPGVSLCKSPSTAHCPLPRLSRVDAPPAHLPFWGVCTEGFVSLPWHPGLSQAPRAPQPLSCHALRNCSLEPHGKQRLSQYLTGFLTLPLQGEQGGGLALAPPGLLARVG